MSNGNFQSSMMELLADRVKLRSVLDHARDSAVRLHRAYNVPMAVSRDGKVAEVSPFDLQTTDERVLQK